MTNLNLDDARVLPNNTSMPPHGSVQVVVAQCRREHPALMFMLDGIFRVPATNCCPSMSHAKTEDSPHRERHH